MYEDGCSHAQAEMRARHDLSTDLTLLTTNKMSGGQQLFGSNNLVIAGREQECRVVHHDKIDRRMAEMGQNRSLR